MLHYELTFCQSERFDSDGNTVSASARLFQLNSAVFDLNEIPALTEIISIRQFVKQIIVIVILNVHRINVN